MAWAVLQLGWQSVQTSVQTTALAARLTLLRLDMGDLESAWEEGQQIAELGMALDPLHDATIYAGMVTLGMWRLQVLAELLSDGATMRHDRIDLGKPHADFSEARP